MNIFDTDTLQRLRLLRHHLAWVSALPLANVPGSPTSFASPVVSLRLNGLGQALIQSPTLAVQVREELVRRGWVHSYDGADSFVVAINRPLRQPLAQPSIAASHPLGPQPGAEDVSSNGPATWRVGRSVITEFPPRPKTVKDLTP